MPPGLKPLLLPQLVEEKRKLELQLQLQRMDDHSSTSTSFASDMASPVTPTFARTHLRFSASLSSLSSVNSESPASPTQPTHPTNKSKSQLPDVQEDPLEREEDDTIVADDATGLYDCLCVDPCTHQSDMLQSTSLYPYDYDLEFLSDTDFHPRQKKRRHGSDAGVSSWSSKWGYRLPSLPRWKAAERRKHFAFSPASDPSLGQHFSSPPSEQSLDQRTSIRAPSSRSSSISVPAKLPETPALSFYESLESLPSPPDDAQLSAGKSIERDRATATTPLLPPLMLEPAARQSPLPSPLQSPTVAPSPVTELAPPLLFSTPPLSTKASASSFRRPAVSIYNEVGSPLPALLDHQDAWSDRLGHANFTIEPRPYAPETADLDSLRTFYAAWDLARINYTKHLVRTGEHYNTTSTTYALTEKKWAETEREWRRHESDLLRSCDRSASPGLVEAAHLRRTTDEMLPAAFPRMLSYDAKFPERGDVDIVGPMVRDPVMVRGAHHEHHKSLSASWFKTLKEKLRR
ncbi:hypothetical protein QBC39DRAFT_344894 [Podospora conica]|nr:hypothetical protein QBC39DRAFT_344894 [Schizothecium conicum]